MKNLFLTNFIILSFLLGMSVAQAQQKPPVKKRQSPKGKARTGQRRQMPAIGKVYGVVIDAATSKPVEFATVALYNMRTKKMETGAIANGKGKFSISEVKLGMYQVKINYIGYKVKTLGPVKLMPAKYGGKGVEQNLGDVKIESAAEKLGEVTVTAEREAMEIKADRKVFNVEKNITSTGGTALEALQNVPSVDVDQDGNVSLRGSANVTVFIDGKPSGLTGGNRQATLEQIPASSIKKIEVITNPSAKYDPDGMSGIINIVLKKNVLRGINGSINLNAGTNDKYSGSARLSLRTGAINAYVNYSGNLFNRFVNSTNFRETYNTAKDTTTYLNQWGDGDMNFHSNLLKAGMDINLNEKNVLSFSALYSLRGFGRDMLTDQRTDQTVAGTRTELARVLLNNELGNKGDNMDFNVAYKRYFNNPDKILSFDVRHSRSAGLFTSNLDMAPRNLDGTPTGGNSYLEKNETDNKFNITTAQLDFELPVNKAVKLEMGWKTTIRDIFNGYYVATDATGVGNYVADASQNNDFQYDEQVHAAYGIYNHQLTKKLSFQAGLRVEQTTSEGVLENTGESFKNEYFNVFPSGFLTYKLSKQGTITANYSRRINRPRTRALNPFAIRVDANTEFKGNPALLPEFINSYELSYTHTWKGITLNTTAYFRDIRGNIQRTSTNNNNIITRSYDNLNSGRNYGVEMAYNMRATKWWNFTLSGNFYKTEIDGSNLEGELNNEAFSYQTKLMSNFKFTSKLNAQITGRYRAPIVFAQGEMQEVYALDAAINYKILKGKGTLGLRVSDVFNNRQFAFMTYDDSFLQNTNFKPETRMAFISFSYRFGKMKMDARKMREMRKKRKNRRRRRNNNVPNDGGIGR